MSTPEGLHSIVLGQLRRAGVPARLAELPAVVLERLAMAAGATNWSFCQDADALALVAATFRPGSRVSFYFDQRIETGLPGPATRSRMAELIEQTGEVWAGPLESDHRSIAMSLAYSLDELAECEHVLEGERRIFFGRFPAPDNDGVAAITVDIADADGIVRAYPH